jgi:hypothetical protein
MRDERCFMKKALMVITVLVLLSLLGAGTCHGKAYIVSGDNLGVDAAWAQFSVKIATDKATYRTDDRLVATITASRDCYILVYYTNDRGECLIVYPNTFESRDHIRGGEAFSIGKDGDTFELIVDKPRSHDFLQVLATDAPIATESLEGIKDPLEFVDRLRYILKKRVEARAARLGKTSHVALKDTVFAIGTTDYYCNSDSNERSMSVEAHEQPAPPVIEDSAAPLLKVRKVDIPSRSVRIVGPSAPLSKTMEVDEQDMKIIYSVSGPEAQIRGTVSYKKGIKTILVDGDKATIYPPGNMADRAIVVEEVREKMPSLDFEYIISNLTAAPRSVIIKAVGVDGKEGDLIVQIRKKR